MASPNPVLGKGPRVGPYHDCQDEAAGQLTLWTHLTSFPAQTLATLSADQGWVWSLCSLLLCPAALE